MFWEKTFHVQRPGRMGSKVRSYMTWCGHQSEWFCLQGWQLLAIMDVSFVDNALVSWSVPK